MSPLLWCCGFALAGVVAAAWVSRRHAERVGLPARVTIDGLFVMLGVGLLTGHMTHLLLYRAEAFDRDWTLILPGSGGACSLGMLGGALLTGVCYFGWRGRTRCLEHADNLALAGSLGWGVGRLGCFAIHDHLSAPTRSPFAIRVGGSFHHDLGLAEAVLCFALFALLCLLERRRLAAGRLFLVAVTVYGSGRFLLDFLREGEPRVLGLTPMQGAIALLLGVSLVAYAWLLARRSFPESSLTVPK
jgi:phosphatidylglycerol---prolipoprotein diacylglyceryl transferase